MVSWPAVAGNAIKGLRDFQNGTFGIRRVHRHGLQFGSPVLVRPKDRHR